MYLSIIFKKIFKTIFSISIFLFLFGFSFSQTEAEPGDIIITEIFTRSNGNIPDYIEIYNKSFFSHNLLNWKISIFGTEYELDESIYGSEYDALELSPLQYLIFTGQDGYFSNIENEVYLANGDQRLIPESPEYNVDFASFVYSLTDTSEIPNAVWLPFALSHSASEIELISDQDIIIDRFVYNSSEYQIGGNYVGHSIEITNDISEGAAFLPYDEETNPSPHNPLEWSYSHRSRPFMFSSTTLHENDNMFMEFGSPGKRNFLSSNISITNLQCGPDPEGSDFCTEQYAECYSQNPSFNNITACLGGENEEWEPGVWDQITQLCQYECDWSASSVIADSLPDYNLFNIHHDRIPGGTKQFMFDGNESISYGSNEIVSFNWYKDGNIFQNGSHIDSEFSEDVHELVLIVKNDDDIWAVDTFNFEILEPNQGPSPFISVDAEYYTMEHDGDPAPSYQGFALTSNLSCDCNDYIRYVFLRYGYFLNDDYECPCQVPEEDPCALFSYNECVDESGNQIHQDCNWDFDDSYPSCEFVDWISQLEDICLGIDQDDCEENKFCYWNPDYQESGDTFPEGRCEYSEIEYIFWTNNGEIQSTNQEFFTNVSDIGDYVYSLILTDTYGENNSDSKIITVDKEINLPPLAVIEGETTINNFTESNGIPYDTGVLDLSLYDDSYDQLLLSGQNSGADPIFSQWYTIDGDVINSNMDNGPVHETELSLGTYTFILEVLDSYNCYAKDFSGVHYITDFEICGELGQTSCENDHPQCRWFEGECTPYCELYLNGECDGNGMDDDGEIIPSGTACIESGINESECGEGGICNLLSADYDTMTVILSEENSPPIVDIGTNNFGYMEEVLDSIIPSVYDIEFYDNNQGDGYCYYGYETDPICDPENDPLFNTREEKCCVQVQWEVTYAHFGNDPENYVDANGDGLDDGWIECNEENITNQYCSESWILTPNKKVLQFIPPINTDFYPDSVKLKLTASDPFYNYGISELLGIDEVTIIIENDNQPPVQIADFDGNDLTLEIIEPYNYLEDEGLIIGDSTSFPFELDLSEYFYDPDGELLNFTFEIPNNQLIDTSVIEIDNNGYIVDSRIRIQNNLDKNGDVQIIITAKDSEYEIDATFSVRVLPNNDIPNAYSDLKIMEECTQNCYSNDELATPMVVVLNGDAGGCSPKCVGEYNIYYTIYNEDECVEAGHQWQYEIENCEDDELDIVPLDADGYGPFYGQFLEDPTILTSETYNYYPQPNFFGYDTVSFVVHDHGSSGGNYDPLTSEIGHIVFHVLKSDNDAPIITQTNFSVKEDYLLNFTVYHPDSLVNDDSLKIAYLGLNVFDEDNNCLVETNDICNDSLYTLDELKVHIDNGSPDSEFFSVSPEDESVIIINENYNNSLTIPVYVSDHEDENGLDNAISDVYNISIDLTTVNDKPYALDTTYNFNEDETFNFILHGEDVQNEDDSLAFEVLLLPTKLDTISPTPFEEAINFDFGETPTINFKPKNNFNGLDSLIYVIHDNGTTNGTPDPLTSDSIVVIFNISQQNDPPQIDTLYFADSSVVSLSEDTSNVTITVVYTDIDIDEDLNEVPSPLDLTWEFNTSSEIDEGLKFWFRQEPPTILEVLENPRRMVGEIILDSLLKDWNGTDTSIIKITDIDGEILNYKFGLTVDPVNDPPTISHISIDTSKFDSLSNWNYDLDGDEIIIAEDSKNIPLYIDFNDKDTVVSLNAEPDTIAGFTWEMSSIKNKLNMSYNSVFDTLLNEDVLEFHIDSLTNNWNGFDSIVTVVRDVYGDSSIYSLPIQIYQVNDPPEPFTYYANLESYPLFENLSTFYNNEDGWTYRLPESNVAISEENPQKLLIKWNRTTDVDLVDSLNNHVRDFNIININENPLPEIINLFYRVELKGHRSGYTYILQERINDTIYNDFSVCDSIIESTINHCEELELNNDLLAYTVVDLDNHFLTYKGSYFDSLMATSDTLTQKLDLSNSGYYYCNNGSNIEYEDSECNGECSGECTTTDYQLHIVAYNGERLHKPNIDSGEGLEGYDFQYTDASRYADLLEGENSDFKVDLKLPDFQFNVIRNDLFWEYYDLYITKSEPILDSIPGEDYNPLLIIEYQNNLIDTVTNTSSQHGPIHYTNIFMDEDSITFTYSARDLVENYGISSKTISYKIVEPMEREYVSTPSGAGELIFQVGNVSEITGVIAEDIQNNFDLNKNLNLKGVSFKPNNLPIIHPVQINFNIDILDIPNGQSWKYKLFKKVGYELIELDRIFEKNNNILTTHISEFGDFFITYNEEAEKPIPQKFVLYQNFPNPFNGSTTIKFELPENNFINLKIINILGETVRNIYSGNLKADVHSFNWDGKDNNLNVTSSGVYFIQLDYNGKKHLQKIMYIK